jgi:hypothetical protein
MISFALLLMVIKTATATALKMSCDKTTWLDLFLYVTVIRQWTDRNTGHCYDFAGGLGHPE